MTIFKDMTGGNFHFHCLQVLIFLTNFPDMPDLEDIDDKESLDGDEAKAGTAAEGKKDKVEAGDKKEGVVKHS